MAPTATVLASASGRTAVVVGATHGVGFSSAVTLAQAGAVRLVLVGRNAAKGEEVVQRARAAATAAAIEIVFIAADLSLVANVRRAAREIAEAVGENGIDILINTAGVIEATPVRTTEGLEASFVVNYLQRFLLVVLLEPLLVKRSPAAPRARVVIVAAPGIHWGCQLDLDDLAGPQASLVAGMDLTRIAQKCNDILIPELDRRWRASATPIDVFVLNPGVIDTGIHAKMRTTTRLLMRVLIFLIGVPLEKAGDAPVALATDPSLDGQGGTAYSVRAKVNPPATITDPVLGKKLWEVSEAIVAKFNMAERLAALLGPAPRTEMADRIRKLGTLAHPTSFPAVHDLSAKDTVDRVGVQR